MKRFLQLGVVLVLLTVSFNVAAQNETRVMQAWFAGNTVFQTPTNGIDSIKGNNDSYVTVYYSDATWSRHANQIDSLTFAMVADGDTTIIGDSVAIDTTVMINIVWNEGSVNITNPYADQGITITTDGGHVTVKSTTTTLNNVVYNLSGSSSNGSLLFNKLSTPVILRLNGVELTSHGSAAINIDKNQNAVLHLVNGKYNAFYDADSNADKAVVYGKGMFMIQGSGGLSVISNFANGLQGKRGVAVNNGNVNITILADSKKGIKSDNDFVMNGGFLNILAYGTVIIDTSDSYDTGYDFSYCTGIKTGDVDDGSVGNIIINGGKLDVRCHEQNAGGRCLSSDYDIIFNGGTIYLSTEGNGMAVGGTGINALEGYACACISADSNVIIKGGKIEAISSGTGGRGLKADGNLIVGTVGADDELIYLYVQTSGAPINAVNTGGHGPGQHSDIDYFKGLPKAIKIEGNIYFNSGHVGAYCAQTSGDPNGEAIESKDSLFINGGIIEANAYDDAINAANYLEINGGKVWCYSRGNDAIDCNGNTNIYGGLVIVKGQEVGIDAATDAGGHYYLNGGIIVCQGGNMGAWDNPNVSGSQKYLQISNNASNGLTVKNSAGDVMLMYKSTTPSGNGFIENYNSDNSIGFIRTQTDPGAKPPPGGGSNSIVFSCPEITSGNYQYWTTSSFNGGTSWHGFYIGSTPTTSGNAQTTTAR